mmetsp:Transcript_65465/g.188635  ORF Transcript_65465/g.188635 Transcript_65465/m.188635 type:complete len:321 (+) Transcript_65465:592-1554(+)
MDFTRHGSPSWEARSRPSRALAVLCTMTTYSSPSAVSDSVPATTASHFSSMRPCPLAARNPTPRRLSRAAAACTRTLKRCVPKAGNSTIKAGETTVESRPAKRRTSNSQRMRTPPDGNFAQATDLLTVPGSTCWEVQSMACESMSGRRCCIAQQAEPVAAEALGTESTCRHLSCCCRCSCGGGCCSSCVAGTSVTPSPTPESRVRVLPLSKAVHVVSSESVCASTLAPLPLSAARVLLSEPARLAPLRWELPLRHRPALQSESGDPCFNGADGSGGSASHRIVGTTARPSSPACNSPLASEAADERPSDVACGCSRTAET